jgi:putative sigma-54 modulation protein
MDFQFVGEHMDLTETLKSYARKRVGKLEKFFPERKDQEIHSRVKLRVENERQIADLQVTGNGEFFEGSASSPDMYASIDQAVDKLGQQLRKYHDKMTNHRKTNNQSAKREIASKVFQIDGEDSDETEPKIKRRRTYTAKPMTVEEAVLQMNSLEYDFFVFTNQVTSEVNVVYRRDDGEYGLIEAQN